MKLDLEGNIHLGRRIFKLIEIEDCVNPPLQILRLPVIGTVINIDKDPESAIKNAVEPGCKYEIIGSSQSISKLFTRLTNEYPLSGYFTINKKGQHSTIVHFDNNVEVSLSIIKNVSYDHRVGMVKIVE